MNGASKILTVSYGTFSCTLEGFDDPFNTMKAIAEYFRDLAADDRFFGAEPPTPDAAMLHKIAEREINRRVEAKIAGNGVVLRAEEAPTEAVSARVAPMPRVTMPATPPAPAAILAPTVASYADAAPSVESAAARLSRLRAVQSQMNAPQPAQTASADVLADISSRFADVDAYAEDQEGESAFKPAPVILTAAPVQVAPAPVEVVFAAPEAAADLIEDIVQATPVAEPAAEAADAVEVSEPEIATSDDAMIAALGLSISAPAAAVVDKVKADGPALDALRETLAGLMVQDDQLADDMASAADDARPATFPEDDAGSPDFSDMAQAEDQADLVDGADPEDLADLAAMDGQALISDDDAQIEDAVALTDFDDAPTDAMADASDVEPPALDAKRPEIVTSPGAPVVAEKLQRARARVIKIRRLDKKADAAAPLSPEAEADLQSTLAALEAEIGPVAAKAAPEQASVPDTGAAAPEKPVESKLFAADEAAVDRLLAQTNTELEVPETKRRRSAIAHLKAAVLATVADRKSNPTARAEVAEVKMDPYRKDLDQAVRPTTAILAGDRPAPLVLVSAQRIDRKRDAVADANRPMPQIVSSGPAPQSAPSNAPMMPVRPRRVTSGGLAQAMSAELGDEDGDPDLEDMGTILGDGARQSFAEFAENLGATSLAELIEAAGAYCTVVLDRPSFSRPLLFQQILTMPNMEGANREEGLRGFGKLLRDGRIQKTVRGQFALSDTSPLLTEAKRIAG